MNLMKIRNFGKLVLAILLCESAGIVGSVFTVSSINSWYQYLTKPIFNPPSWLFGPVWTILYLLMGISLYLVWQKKKISIWFWKQLILNAIWSPVFFGLKSPGLALIIILVLWYAIVRTIQDFKKVDKTASYLLYPYLAWVSFATLLNFSIWLINN